MISPSKKPHPTRDLKFCVFCGKPPSKKILEHVIPRWLIELTGDPKRTARFGPFWNSEKAQLENLEIPFDQFKFPSCEECNTNYSDLEGRAKKVIASILDDIPLDQDQLFLLLTWLDKIRVGLWLAIFYLHRCVSGIEPHMFIESRLNKTDRITFIYKSDYLGSRLNFPGTNTPSFQYLPCCFTLIINNYAFFNMATDFLISRRIGLPYPEESWWEGWPKVAFAMVQGSGRVRLPLIRKSLNTRCAQIYQPMFSRKEIRELIPSAYDNDYVRSLALDHDKGIGKVFVTHGRRITEYPTEKSLLWLPGQVWSEADLEFLITKQTLDFQNYLMDLGPKHKGLESDRASISKQQHQLSRNFNRTILKKIRSRW